MVINGELEVTAEPQSHIGFVTGSPGKAVGGSAASEVEVFIGRCGDSASAIGLDVTMFILVVLAAEQLQFTQVARGFRDLGAFDMPGVARVTQ